MDKISRAVLYPLKVYLSANDAVVLSYSGNFFADNFEVEDISCIVPKTDFYNILKTLESSKYVKINYGKKSISILDGDSYTKTTISNGNKEEVIVEKDRGFIDWLLSIDLRKSERVNGVFPVSVENKDVFGYGNSIDISNSGFKIELDVELKEAEKINLNIFDKDYPISSCVCDVRYKKQVGDKFVYGLRILDITIENIYNLDHLINNLK